MLGNAKQKTLELPHHRKTVNQKWYHISGGIAEASAPMKDLEDRDGDSHHVPIQPAHLACAEYR